MKAWMVRDKDEHNGTIMFNDHGLAARRLGAEELDMDFDDVECQRAKEFDKYNGLVPVKDLIKEHGWWFECYHCYKKICDSMDDFDKVIYAGPGTVYCSPECQQGRKDEISKIDQESFDFYISLVNGWCRWDIVQFDGGYPILSPSAKFTFPGAKYTGTISASQHYGQKKKELMVYVANVDRESYERDLIVRFSKINEEAFIL